MRVQGVQTIANLSSEPDIFMRGTWKELADGKWEGIEYQLVIGVPPRPATGIRQQLPIAVKCGISRKVQHGRWKKTREGIMKEIVPEGITGPHPLLHRRSRVRPPPLEYFPNLYIDLTGIVPRD
ncbi:hypothetical protein ARMSODRAFT_1025591 [Armillaria solidipes]|uniref:Uncharacterized protein n=1 Tax=Armillaria solidipes TaxID=1076256 RepID=A0A2H3AXK9_9AGAR|nr:hypothetical protein ARMSODRAFT_1025591 [Armillaria solidipes]